MSSLRQGAVRAFHCLVLGAATALAACADDDVAMSVDGKDGGAAPGAADGADGAVAVDPDSNDPSQVADAGTDASRDGSANGNGAVPTAGCGKPATSGATTRTITVGALDRSYILSIPAGYAPGRPYPLVFAWHGQSGTAAHFRAGDTSYGGHGGGVETAAGGKAIFIYPLGTIREGGKTGWQVGAGIDLNLFDALVTSASNSLCVDSSRIMSFGYSYGARMSNQLACMRPNVLRAIGSVAGYIGTNGSTLIGTCSPGAVGVWIHMSDDDNVVAPLWGSRTRDYWRTAHSCATTTKAVTPAPCVAYDGCAAGSPLTWCSATDYLHAWPEYAEAALWNFFKSF